MFLLGIASILQLVFLPGFIILRLLKVTTANTVQSLLYSMGLSLYANYCAVCALTWLHIYIPQVVFALFVLELAAALLIAIRSLPSPHAPTTAEDLYRKFSVFVSSLPVLQKYFFIAACLVLLFFASLIPFSAGSAYYFSDALMHWSRWPAAWASNALPTGTSHYPQLFPANLSLIHLFTGAPDLRFFPKLLMPAFFLGILLMFMDLYCATRSFVYLAAFFIYSAFLLVFYSLLFILEVNADIPVSFFALLTFYSLLRGDAQSNPRAAVLLAAVFAVGAANTKLAGMYVLVPACASIAYYCYRRRAELLGRTAWRLAAALIVVGGAGFFWYAIQPAEMIGGLNQSVYLRPDYTSRVVGAATMLLYTLGAPLILFLVLTFALSTALREGRLVLGVMVMPALIVWALFFSADYRNLSFVIPFASLASAYGLKVAYRSIVRGADDLPARVVHLYRGTLFALVKIAVPVCIIIVVQTDAFFNLCMNIAYGLNAHVFNYYRVVYTTELGYYRSVELYRSALSLASALVLVIMPARHLRVRTARLVPAICAAALLLLTLLLPNDALWRRQAHDEAMTNVRNGYYRLRPYLPPQGSALVVSNNAAFARLVPPRRTAFVYASSPDADSSAESRGPYDAVFLLLENDAAHAASSAAVKSSARHAVLGECFNDNGFILYRVEAPHH